MLTRLEQKEFVEQKLIGSERTVQRRLSATGVFSTTTSVGLVMQIGVTEGSSHITSVTSGLARESVILTSERKRPGLAQVAELRLSAGAAAFAPPGAMQWVEQLPVGITAPIAQAAQALHVTAMQELSRLVAGLACVITEQDYQAAVRETVSPQAEDYAKSLGAYGSLIESKKLVRETFPNLRRLAIDREDDPDEGGHPVIRFNITTRESVERVLELDDLLLDAFCHEIPPRHQPYFTFTYQFDE